jgi:phage host-nuclease inhibitor protein Gam
VPTTAAEADSFIRNLGAAARELDRIDTQLQATTALAKEQAEAEAAPFRETHAALLAGLEIYAAANRKDLTHDDRVKTVKTPAGVFGWRLKPPSVRTSGKLDMLIASIRGMRLTHFLREKVELDKDAMLADAATAATIPGVKIASAGEVFFVEPATLGLAPAAAA